MTEEQKYKTLQKLEKYLNKPLKLPLVDSKYLDFKIDYIKHSIMYSQGRPHETLRMAITVLGGWMPLFIISNDSNYKIHPTEMTDILRQTLQKAAHNYMFAYLIRDFLQRKTKYFGFDHVNIDKINYLDED